MKTSRIGIAIVLIAMAASVFAQSDMRGHWTGTIDTPVGPLGMEIDLDKADGGWIGSLSIPAQNAVGMPLDAISFNAGKGTFRIKGAPNDPTFTGTLSADGKSLEGTISLGPSPLALKLSRTGDAKVDVPKPSPSVATQFLGTWSGTIDSGPGLRIELTITNGKAGAEAVMVSLDQNNAKIPVSSITYVGSKLLLLVNAAGGSYQGDINADGTELTGTWTQLGNSVPLNFKKAAAKP